MKMFCKSYCPFLKTASLIILILTVLSCDKKQETAESLFNGKVPDEQADSVKIFAYTNDLLDYELNAFHIDKYYNTQQTFADTVLISTYNPDSSLKSTLYCDRAEMDESRNILIGTGNVKIKSENGILKTQYLIWDRNTNNVFAKDGVTIIRDDNILRGEELKTDINLNDIEITRVSAEGKLDEVDIDW